jgi:hypothetical protein
MVLPVASNALKTRVSVVGRRFMGGAPGPTKSPLIPQAIKDQQAHFQQNPHLHGAYLTTSETCVAKPYDEMHCNLFSIPNRVTWFYLFLSQAVIILLSERLDKDSPWLSSAGPFVSISPFQLLAFGIKYNLPMSLSGGANSLILLIFAFML